MVSKLWASVNVSSPSSSSSGDADDEYTESSFVNKSKDELIEEAGRLRAKAKAILAEARAMEVALQESASKKHKSKLQQVDDIISSIFSSLLVASSTNAAAATTTSSSNKKSDVIYGTGTIPDARVVADRIQNGRYNREQILSIVDRLFDLQLRSRGETITATTVEVIPTFQIGGGGMEQTTNETAYELYEGYLEALTHAATLIDEGNAAISENDYGVYSLPPEPSSSTQQRRLRPLSSPSESSLISDSSSGRLEIAIRSRIKELRKIQELNMNRRLAAEINKVVTSFNRSSSSSSFVQDYTRQTFDDIDSNDPTILPFTQQQQRNNNSFSSGSLGGMTTEIIESSLVPLWVPSTFLPYMVSSDSSTVGPEEVETIKSKVLLGSRFFVTSYESAPGAALFRGNIRSASGRVIGTTDGAEGGNSGNMTAVVFADIQDRLQNAGLAGRVQLFFMPDPEVKPEVDGRRPNVAAMDEEEKPVILALSKALSPDETKMKRYWFKPFGKVRPKVSMIMVFLGILLLSSHAD
jgi:hypothetical protein